MSRSSRLLLAALTFGWALISVAELQVPPLTGHVIDQTETLSTEQKAALEQSLTALEARKGSQLSVLIVASTAPEEIEQYALRVAEQWQLGRKNIDDGAILVIAKNDRALRIEVGYGLEGALNDATSKRIISEIILPRFKRQDFYGGIRDGVEQIVRVIDGEALPAPIAPTSADVGAIQQYIPLLFILALGVGAVLRASLGKGVGSVVTGGVVALIAWFAAGGLLMPLLAGVAAVLFSMFGGSMSGYRHGGFYGGLSNRGGGFHGGGGGFGGGGASGRW
ncbi:YgcG family protein [Pseudomonas sp. WS 5021]|nr:YgcG family protein [Pseudomonas sp. ANT_H4]KAA0946468.1 YgcG family protein [Pseudomonas sp. ANT_H14]NMX42355.1 YgcG family protein [Pseudomonas veronii]NMY29362.1 YgcG family protein [Pseudomonas sp. WS 5021]